MIQRDLLLRGIFLVLLPLSAWGIWQVLQFSATKPTAVDAIELNSAVFMPVTSETPPKILQDIARQVTLPHDWRGDYSHAQAWYLFDLDLQVPPNRLWGIYLGEIEQNAVVYLNGEIAGSRGQLAPYPSRFVNQSLYFPLANGLIKPGRNQIAIRVVTHPAGQGFLGPVFIGPDASLRPYYDQKSFIQSDLLWFFSAGSFAMCIAVSLLAWQRRREKVYQWLSVQTGLWTLQTSLSLLVTPVIPDHWLITFIAIATTWFCATSFFFVFRFIDIRPKILEGYILGSATICSLILLFTSLWSDTLVYQIGFWAPAAQMLVGPMVMYRLVERYFVTRNPEYFLVFYAGCIVMIFGLSSFEISSGVTSAVGGQYLFYATPLILGALVVLLFHRFVLALETSEQLTRNLDNKVREKTAALEENHHKLLQLEHEQTLAVERERIMRDMHDGVGGQLVSSLARLNAADADGVRQNLEQALTDLRLMIDSLEGIDGDLNVALGMLRTRLEPQLDAAGIQILWQAEELPLVPHLNPEIALQIMRILQEAITNVIKHARATQVTVKANFTEQWIDVEIIDNGDGFAVAQQKGNGRGLRNMQYRATSLDAQLSIRSSTAGTRVRLRLRT